MRYRSGGCSCGAVRYKVAGEPLRAGICHCTSCRKESGSVFTAFAVWPESAFETSGERGSGSAGISVPNAARGCSRSMVARPR